jgi:hypothetical protein
MREKIKKYIVCKDMTFTEPSQGRVQMVGVVMMKMTISLHKWVFFEGLLQALRMPV